MGFFVEDSGVILTQAALILTILRWVLTWLLRFRNRDDNEKTQDQRPFASSQMIRESLTLSTYGDVIGRAPLISDTCAVCLAPLSVQDEVRELRNCCHVFHKECIDRWLDYDHDHDDHENHKTCPLCRAPLLTSSQSVGWAKSEPSWAVERLLYLFGDDLLMCSTDKFQNSPQFI